jgi:hypothetical protein
LLLIFWWKSAPLLGRGWLAHWLMTGMKAFTSFDQKRSNHMMLIYKFGWFIFYDSAGHTFNIKLTTVDTLFRPGNGCIKQRPQISFSPVKIYQTDPTTNEKPWNSVTGKAWSLLCKQVIIKTRRIRLIFHARQEQNNRNNPAAGFG